MDPILKDLIKLYAANSTEVLESSNGGPLFEEALNTLFFELIKNPAFINGKEIVRKFKKILEAFEREAVDSKQLMTNCLLHSWNFSAIEGGPYKVEQLIKKMNVFSTLALETFKARWTDAQIAHFNNIISVFLEYNFYFLSYTNHNVKNLNDRYKNIYKAKLEPDEYSVENMFKYNLLAKAIVRELNLRNLNKGFYDQYSIRDAEIINDKAIGQAGQSISLVQLISRGSFQQQTVNWSFKEFDAYQASRKDRSHMIFFLTEEEAIPKLIPDGYDEWEKKIRTVKYDKFFEVNDVKNFERKIDELIKAISVFNTEMLSAIPG
jgi:hypothetical protein